MERVKSVEEKETREMWKQMKEDGDHYDSQNASFIHTPAHIRSLI